MHAKATAAAILTITAGVASADIVQFEFIGTVAGTSMQTTLDGTRDRDGFAGSILHEVDGVETVTYCAEFRQTANFGIENFDAIDPTDAFTRDAGIGRVVAELGDIGGDAVWGLDATGIDAAAFQIALWEIVEDYDSGTGASSLDLASGNFMSTGVQPAVDRAQEFIDLLAFDRADASGYTAYVNDQYQDFIGRTIPTPGALAVAAIGAPLLVSRRQR
jgi:hypothetical protein